MSLLKWQRGEDLVTNKSQILPYLAGLCFSVIFGLSFIFAKEGLTVLQPFHLLAFRFGVAMLFISILKLTGIIKMNFKHKNLKALLILTIFQPVLYFICELTGLNRTTASEAGMMIALVPVVVAILSTIFLKEAPTKLQSFFIGLSVLGVIFIMVMTGSVDLSENLAGMFILLGAVFSAGIFNILSRKSSMHFNAVEITYVMMCVGLAFFGSLSIAQHVVDGRLHLFFEPLRHTQALVSILYLGLVSSVVGFFMVNYMLSKIEASRSAVFANLITIVSIIAGVVLLGDPFYWYHGIGSLLIIVGVWGTNYFRKKTQ
jgi:drug/metabolite transporter (DMT)-like permease